MNAKYTLMQSLILALLNFCTGNVIITSTFTTLQPLGYLQCSSMCLEYSACETIFYSKTKLDCRLNYLNNDIINYLAYHFKTFIRLPRSTIRQLPPPSKNSSVTHECPKTKRRVMLKTSSFACISFLPANTSLQNVALNKRTLQRSTIFNGASRRAVDGNWRSKFSKGSCTHTASANGSQWWMVDLAHLYHIYEIRIQNRGDCCGNRLKYFTVRVGLKTDDMKIVGYYNGVAKNGERIKFLFSFPVFGRYVMIVKGGPQSLVLCEVAVYAHRDKEK